METPRDLGPRAAVLAFVLLATAALLAAGCSGSDTAGAPTETGGRRASGTVVTNGTVGTNGPTTGDAATGSTTPGGAPIVKIGALVSQTGAGAPYGVSQLKGIQLGVDQLNARHTVPGVRFELVVRDDASRVDQAKKALTELIEDEGIVALFGPTLSSVAAQVDRIAVAAGVPVLAISNTTLDILTVGEPFWRVALTDPSLARTNLELVRERFGVRKVGLVWDPNDRHSRDVADRFRTAAEQAGVALTGEVAFTGGTADLSPTVQQAQDLGVEALLVAASDADARRFFGAVDQGRARLDFTIIGNSVWRVALSERTLIPTSVGAAKARRGVTRAVLVSDPDDQYSKGAADAFRAAAAAEGVTIVDDVRFRSGQTNDFSAAFSDVATKGANGFFVAALSTDASSFLQQRLAAGLTGIPIVGGAGFQNIQLVQQVGPAAAGLIGGAAWIESRSDEASVTFVRDYRAVNQADPDQWAALGYGGVQLLTEAMRVGDGTNRSAIRAGLADLKDAPTVLGPVTFSDQREARYDGLVQTVEDNRFVPLT